MASMNTAVTLDRYAEIRAEMEAGAQRDEALARAGLSTEDWTTAQRAWLERMSAEIKCGRFELNGRYAQAFLERQRALMVEAARARDARAAAEAPSAMTGPDAVAPPVEVTPTYLMPTAPAASPPMPAPLKPNPLLAATMAVDKAAFGAALPFQAQSSAAPPAPPRVTPMPAVKRPPAELSGTAIGSVLPKGPALPFPSGAPSPAPVSAPPASSAPVAPGVKRAPAALSGTSMAIVMPKGPALPFARSEAPSPAPAPVAAAPPGPAALSGTTSFELTPEILAAMGKQGALPFAETSAPAAPPPPPPPPDQGLTIERYAALCAELAAFPAQQNVVFERYGLADPSARAAVDAAWKERLGRDAAEYRRWQVLYQEHQARVSRQGK